MVEDLTTNQVGIAEVHAVLQELLADQVPIRDLVRILETISAQARITRDTETLAEACRVALAPAICAERATGGQLPVLSLDPMLEQHLLQSLTRGERGSSVVLDPELAQALSDGIAETVRSAEQLDQHPVLVCSPPLRPALRKFSRRVVPHLPVLSFDELAPQFTINDLGAIRVAQEN